MEINWTWGRLEQERAWERPNGWQQPQAFGSFGPPPHRPGTLLGLVDPDDEPDDEEYDDEEEDESDEDDDDDDGQMIDLRAMVEDMVQEIITRQDEELPEVRRIRAAGRAAREEIERTAAYGAQRVADIDPFDRIVTRGLW